MLTEKAPALHERITDIIQIRTKPESHCPSLLRRKTQHADNDHFLPWQLALKLCRFWQHVFASAPTHNSHRPPIPVSNSGSLHNFVASAAPPADTSSKEAEIKKIQDRVRHRQSVLLEQTNELQELEKRLQAAEARKKELESRGGFI